MKKGKKGCIRLVGDVSFLKPDHTPKYNRVHQPLDIVLMVLVFLL